MKRLSLFGLLLALVLGLGLTSFSQAEQGIVVVPDSDAIQVDISVRDAFGNPRGRFQINETVEIVVDTSAPSAGHVYLNVVDIDANGKCTLIFPNAFSPNPQVPVGRYVLPDRGIYRLRVVPPEGTEYVQAFASLEPLDLRQLFNAPATGGDPFPTLCANPEQFAQQVQAAIQGIVAESKIATAWTSFIVGSQPTNRRPVASFTLSQANPQVGETVFFDASASFDPDGSIVRYEWNFGDGNTATGRFVSHTYRFSGAFTATLTVTDNRGATAATHRTISVGAPTNQPPVASFNTNPANPRVGETVRFTSTSYDPDGFITQHRWDFGDGFTAAGSTAFHAYASSGIYTVTLTVIDNQGRSASTGQQVFVGTAPPPPTQAGFFIDAVDDTHIRVTVQGRADWFTDRGFRILLETDGRFTSVERRVSGNVAPQGIVPGPVNEQRLDLVGTVRTGRIDYIIGLSPGATKIKFDLRLDIDGDGQLERDRGFVFLGNQMKHPPSNPFVISFPAGQLAPFLEIKVCLVLVDQPGFQFIICFRFGSL